MTGMSSRKLTRREAIGAMGAAVLAACFSDRPTDPGDGGGIPVDMVDTAFEPATLTIQVGERVTWHNVGQFVHTVTCDPAEANDPASVQLPAGAAPWDSGGVGPGGTFTHTFDVAGEYHYFCIPHETFGMLGTVVVT